MTIEYTITFDKNGVRVKQSLNGGCSTTGSGGGDPPKTGSGGGDPPKTGSGGGDPPKTGSGGGDPPKTGSGGGGIESECCPAIVFGPIILGACGCVPRRRADSLAEGAVIPENIPVVDGPPTLDDVRGRTPTSIPAPLEIAKFNMEVQKQPNWCWAAVASAIQKHSPANSTDPKHKLEQCQVASRVLGAQDCCSDPSLHNDQASLEMALLKIGKYQWAGVCQASLAGIVTEISNGRPVGARIAWDPEGDHVEDGAHFVAIYGCYEKNGMPYLKVRDPNIGPPDGAANELDITYQDFCNRYRLSGTWVATYFVKG